MSHGVMEVAKAVRRDLLHGHQSKVISLLAKYFFFNCDNDVKTPLRKIERQHIFHTYLD